MSLKIKIFFSFMLLVIMLIIAGLMSVMEFRKFGSSVNTVMENNYKSVEQTKLMLDALERQDSGLLMFLIGNRTHGSEIISSADSMMTVAIEVAKNNITEKDENMYIETVRREYDRFHSSVKNAIESGYTTSLEEQNSAYFIETHKLFFSVKEAVYALMEINEAGIYRQTTTMKDNAKRAVMPVMVSIAAAIIFAVLLHFFITEYFVSPIRRIKNEVASFYPEQYVPKANIRSKDEIKQLENEINRLIQRLLAFKDKD